MSEYNAIYSASELKHALPPGILRAIAIQESAEMPWAGRYEPGFFRRYLEPYSKANLPGVWPAGVSEATERSWRATSWGLMQVMGEVAREYGFTAPFLSMLCVPEIGVAYGASHLKAKLNKYGNLEDALSAYNAGSPTQANRESYVRPILERMGKS